MTIQSNTYNGLAKVIRKQAVFAVLCVLLVVIWVVRHIAGADAPIHAEPGSDFDTALNANKSLQAATPDLRAWPSTLRRDVFASRIPAIAPITTPLPTINAPDPAIIQREAEAKLRVQAVLMSDPAQAIVNGIAVREGHSVSGYTVQSIYGRSVRFERDGCIVCIVIDGAGH